MKIGQRIAHYHILEKLGEGGMGLVYRGEDTRLGRDVALKFLPPNLLQSEESKRRFINEARAASRLDHANICSIYEIGDTKAGQLYIAMAYYQGETLQQRITRGTNPVTEAIDIAIQICEGLQRAHEAGIIHRDIKPANIMITEQGEVKILDFGLAKLVGESRLTQSGSTFGTQAYMSPEQTQGQRLDARTDIWSLGVVLYEMLTGQLPFRAENQQGLAYAIVSERHVPAKRINAALPKAFSDVVDRCLLKRSAYRYHSM